MKRPAPTLSITASPLLLVALLWGCAGSAGSRSSADEPPRRTDAVRTPDPIPPPDSSWSASATPEEERPNLPSLGERLGRLDAQIASAPPERARELRDDYRRMLAEHTGEEIATGGGESERSPSVVNIGAPVDVSPGTAVHAKAEESAPSIPVAENPLAATREPNRRTSRDARSRRTSAATPRDVEPAVGSSRMDDGRRLLLDGIAAGNAGRTREALDRLESALKRRDLNREERTRGELETGRLLEESNRPREAARRYARAAKRGGSTVLGHAARLAQARALARAGDRGAARRLLLALVRKHPKSEAAVEARRLLQTL